MNAEQAYDYLAPKLSPQERSALDALISALKQEAIDKVTSVANDCVDNEYLAYYTGYKQAIRNAIKALRG
jgi:hypothetical protein